jgi:hypothetical protein
VDTTLLRGAEGTSPGLHDTQRLAALAPEGPTLIVGRGRVGKTLVLIHRVAHGDPSQVVPVEQQTAWLDRLDAADAVR